MTTVYSIFQMQADNIGTWKRPNFEHFSFSNFEVKFVFFRLKIKSIVAKSYIGVMPDYYIYYCLDILKGFNFSTKHLKL